MNFFYEIFNGNELSQKLPHIKSDFSCILERNYNWAGIKYKQPLPFYKIELKRFRDRITRVPRDVSPSQEHPFFVPLPFHTAVFADKLLLCYWFFSRCVVPKKRILLQSGRFLQNSHGHPLLIARYSADEFIVPIYLLPEASAEDLPIYAAHGASGVCVYHENDATLQTELCNKIPCATILLGCTNSS